MDRIGLHVVLVTPTKTIPFVNSLRPNLPCIPSGLYLTFKDLVDVAPEIIHPVLVLQLSGCRVTVLGDIDGRVAVPVSDPVDETPESPRHGVQPDGAAPGSIHREYGVPGLIHTPRATDRGFRPTAAAAATAVATTTTYQSSIKLSSQLSLSLYI